jgi:hypothetical protein
MTWQRNWASKSREAYTCPNEHTVHFILESEYYKSNTGFLSGFMLTNHMAGITPVITLKESVEIITKGT